MKTTLLIALALSICVGSFAQTPQLIKNISAGSSSSGFQSAVSYNHKLVFTVDSGRVNGNANQLWITDGTQSGTQLLRSFAPYKAMPTPVELNGKLYFIANDTIHGNELWVTDGTIANTHMVIDINPGSADGADNLVVLNGNLYFGGYESQHGYELWRSDGTSSGTQMVFDINGTPGTSGLSGDIVVANNKLFFAGNDGWRGTEIWSSDGTAANTAIVKNLDSIGTNVSYIDGLFAAGNKVYFTEQMELSNNGMVYPYIAFCVTDGTAGGTQILNYYLSASPDYAVLNGKVYFYARSYNPGNFYQRGGLWMTDGTPAGTSILKDSIDFSSCSGIYKPLGLTTYKGKIYFGSAAGAVLRNQLWTTDGTTAGTQLLVDFQPTTSNNNQVNPMQLTIANGSLYFKAYDEVHNQSNLWKSDGTASGTKVISYPGINRGRYACYQLSTPITLVDSDLYYGMNYDSSATGLELYRVQASSAVNGLTKDGNSFTLFPIPASDHLSLNATLTSPTTIDVDLISIQGQLIQHLASGKRLGTGQSTLNYSVSELPSGLYMLRIRNEEMIQPLKVIVQH